MSIIKKNNTIMVPSCILVLYKNTVIAKESSIVRSNLFYLVVVYNNNVTITTSINIEEAWNQPHSALMNVFLNTLNTEQSMCLW